MFMEVRPLNIPPLFGGGGEAGGFNFQLSTLNSQLFNIWVLMNF